MATLEKIHVTSFDLSTRLIEHSTVKIMGGWFFIESQRSGERHQRGEPVRVGLEANTERCEEASGARDSGSDVLIGLPV